MRDLTTEELLDIVDENNLPLGFRKNRGEVHNTMQYWHRATHIWIVNNDKQVLCQQRSKTKDVNPRKWQSFFGGHLKTGQSYLENAIEELSEELGLSINKSDLTPVYILKGEQAKHFGQVFILWWSGEVHDLNFETDEVAAIRWIALDEIRSQIKNGFFCNNIDPKVEDIIKKHDASATRY